MSHYVRAAGISGEFHTFSLSLSVYLSSVTASTSFLVSAFSFWAWARSFELSRFKRRGILKETFAREEILSRFKEVATRANFGA